MQRHGLARPGKIAGLLGTAAYRHPPGASFGPLSAPVPLRIPSGIGGPPEAQNPAISLIPGQFDRVNLSGS